VETTELHFANPQTKLSRTTSARTFSHPQLILKQNYLTIRRIVNEFNTLCKFRMLLTSPSMNNRRQWNVANTGVFHHSPNPAVSAAIRLFLTNQLFCNGVLF